VICGLGITKSNEKAPPAARLENWIVVYNVGLPANLVITLERESRSERTNYGIVVVTVLTWSGKPDDTWSNRDIIA
jgi:hypothetical protein